MNERIKELAAEANKDSDGNIPFGFAEKFAELILREFINIGEQWADGLIDEHHYAFVNKKIKEHFETKE